MIFTKANLIETLQNNIVTVTFTKVNGQERIIKCTLLSEHIPNAPTANGKTLIDESNSVIAVWDLENNGWRAFRVEGVKSISIGS